MNHLKKSNLIRLALPFILLLIALNTIAIFVFKFDKGLYAQRENDLIELRALTAEIMKNVADFDMQSRTFVLIQNKRFEQVSRNCLVKHEVGFAKMDSLFEELDYHPEGFAQLVDSVYDYYAFTFPIFDLVRAGKQDVVIEMLSKDRGKDLWFNVVKFRKPVYAFIDKEVADIETRQSTLIFINTVLQSILAVLGIPILVFLIWTLRKNDLKNKALLAGLQYKNEQLIFNQEADEVNKKEVDIDEVVERITENLEKSHQFVEQITEGNYEVNWDGMDAKNRELNHDNLSGKLILMRDQMQKVKKENESRMWFNKGIGKLTELLRGKQGADSIDLDEVLAFLIKQVGASLGSLFIVEEADGEKALSLIAAYAYNRKKYINKTIKIGEGLIGQTYLEKEIVRLQKVPKGYVNIASGLGNADPKELVVLPLLNHMEVVGVLEIASFAHFEDRQISFLLKAAEIIASSLSFQRNARTTLKILEESQELTEKLRSSEEEMRQNMEEMHATQEELKRVNQDANASFSAIDGHFLRVELSVKGTVIRANKNMLDLLQYSEEEVMGIHHQNLVSKEKRQSEAYEQFWATLRSGEKVSGEFERIRKDGQPIWLKGFYTPIKNSQGQITRILKFAYDITMEKQREAVLSN